MTSAKGLIFSLLLIGFVLSQTDFKNTCQNSSLLPGIATGVITLNPMDTFNAGANKDYYQDLSVAKFLPIDVLGYAFALSSFQTNCGQNYYALGVDIVEFQNQNTRMRIVINFRSTTLNIISKWTQVSFTYIVVSRTFSGAYSDIWATVAETKDTSAMTGVDKANVPIDTIGEQWSAFPTSPGTCQMYIDPNMAIDPTTCDPAILADAAGLGGTAVIHAYIMGFQWNPAKSATNFLAASVIKGDGATDPTSDSLSWGFSAQAGPPGPNGPQISIKAFGGALQWIKVGFVYSRYDAVSLPGTVPSILKYSSAHVFQKVTTYNAAVPITNKNTPSLTTGYNPNYPYAPYRLPDNRYAIYGLSAFTLPVVGAKNCTQITVSAVLNNLNTYTITTPSPSPTDFYFSADIYTVNKDTLCASTVATVPTVTDIVTVGKKDYFTIPTQSIDQNIIETPTNILANNEYPVAPAPQPAGKVIILQHSANTNGNNDTVTLRTIIPYIGLTVGAPTEFEFGIWQDTAGTSLVDSSKVNVLVQVNGLTIYQTTLIASSTAGTQDFIVGIVKGLNINSATAEVSITIQMKRDPAAAQFVYTYLAVSTYVAAYDPTTGCCTPSCPANTGLDVSDAPPVCVYCNSQVGLFYNPANGTCTCQSGYYLLQSTTFQCFACSALYCAICNPANPAQCTTCVPGGVLNTLTQTCVCGTGYYVSGTVCQVCPYNCQTCNSPSGSCSTCVDPTRRDSTQNCKCVNGYFDSGSVNCTICSPTCLTCSNAQTCTSCDASKFRNLTGTVCSCQNGYYELTYDNLTRACQKCNPECLTCSVSPSACLTCDPSKNRVSGVDSLGNPTCLCQSGFYSTPDGSCIQSNCNADPFCSQCEQGLQLCIQCLASRYRVIKLPEARCVCMDGYYADASNNCVPCQSGCGICSSKPNCSACVALATPNGDGSCSCPPKTYFTISIDGVRYCSNCGPYCNVCVNSTTCTTCAPSYTKTADNQCVCSARNFVDPKGNCVPCASGCGVCTSATNCTQCLTPLVLQGTVCQANCNNGFTVSGSVCLGCPKGCLQCTQNFACFYCEANYYLYKGSCYDVCPAGTIGDRSTGNWQCIPCNSPCQTCINHPSFCTSCQPGKGYLATSAIDQSCVPSCNDGTFALNGVCQVCDFSCATCLGSATNCISCPIGQLLYQGGCWANCPAILLTNSASCGSTVGSCCVDNCPDGFYKLSQSSCAPCSPQCTTCSGGMDNCTSCLQGSVSLNGTCVVKCGENQFNFRGICLACSASCYGCQNLPTNCITCAAGYVQSGSLCQKGCLTNQYYDNTLQRCVNCDSTCATCTSVNYCITCANVNAVPRGGVCSSCPYPCSTCDQFGKCTSCLSGFYFFQGQCQTTCPSGAVPVNGICRCASGIVSNGQCVNSCSSGFTNINGACIACNSNCAECSGTVNTCTKCLNGFAIDPSTNLCVSSTQCPYGQESSNGVCVNICDNGFYYFEGACLYGTCSSSSVNNYIPNAYGGCIRNTAVIIITTSCPSGRFLLNGGCVASCGSNFYPDTTSGNCVACADGCVSCFSGTYCVTCQTGYSNNAGTCVKGNSCSSTQLQYGTGCVNSCPAGNYQIAGICQRTCPPNTYYQSQVCYSSCPTNIRTADACVPSCPVGTSNKQGVCA